MEIWKALKSIIQLVEALHIKELDYSILGELKNWNNEHEESGPFKDLKNPEIEILKILQHNKFQCLEIFPWKRPYTIETRKMFSLILENWKFINTKMNEIQKVKKSPILTNQKSPSVKLSQIYNYLVQWFKMYSFFWKVHNAFATTRVLDILNRTFRYQFQT